MAAGRPAPQLPASRFPGALAAAEGERAVMAMLASAAYLTHQQKVLRLYKRALRHVESWCVHRCGRRIQGAGGDPGDPHEGREAGEQGWGWGAGDSRTSGTERESGPGPHRSCA